MFNRARFVVIDNEKIHLDGIAAALASHGSGCRTIHYNPEDGTEKLDLTGVRVLFTDLHLIPGTTEEAGPAVYGEVVNILLDCIPPTSGPYILCLWTRHPDELDRFRQFMHERMPDEVNVPLKTICLDKTAYIELGTGATVQGSGLADAITDALLEIPQLAAMMSLETDIIRSADSVITSLVEHANAIQPGDTLNALDLLFNHLGDAAVGNDNIRTSPRRAVSSTVIPLLADNVLNTTQTAENQRTWERSIQYRPALDPLPNNHASRLMASLHLSQDPIPQDCDWGAVYKIPEYSITVARFRERFGVSPEEYMLQVMKIKEDRVDTGNLVFIRTGAHCDFAQNQLGPLQCLLGIEVVKDDLNRGNWSANNPWWKTPNMSFDGERVFQVRCHPNFVFTSPRNVISGWIQKYRIREQLLNQLTTSVSGHHSRPAITKFRE